MASKITQRRSKSHDPDARYGADKGITPNPKHPLDSDEMANLARQFEEWWIESRDMHAESRRQRFIDHDYYDHDQLTPADRAVYESRHQAPVVYNLVHGAIDWLSGTERRTRIDWSVQPRGPEDEQGAKAQTHVLKYISDANRAPWERSRAFKDACISGVGFVEEFLRRDRSQERVGFAYSDWRYLWCDPYSRDLDFGDARYFHRVKFADLDRSIAMFPGRAADLRAVAVSTVDNEYELLDELDGIPGMLVLSGNGSYTRGGFSGLRDRYSRQRVRLIETWYPRAIVSKEIQAEIADCADLMGVTYDPESSELREKVEKGQITVIDAVTTRMSLGIWTPGLGMLQHNESPYRHNMIPFSATWCFRHHRDGMPYGFVRGQRDPQDEYNKRRAKALFAASVNQVLYEDDAWSEDDEDDNLEQVAMPNGEVRLAPGGLKKIEIRNNLDVSKTNVQFQLEAKEQIFEGSGITRENLGQETNSISGRAILAKQQQGAISTAEVFDLYRLMHEISGQKTLELAKQGMSTPRQIQIIGENDGKEWLKVNQPYYNHDTQQVEWENDILNTLSDFKVAQQDFRETMRLAMAESLFETIGKMPPEMAIQLIDLAVELTDLPNKEEFIARVRKLNGMTPAPTDPNAEAANAAAQEDANLTREERMAKIEKERAAAELQRAQAKKTAIGAKADAINTTQMAAAAIPIAQAADELYAGASATPPTPVPAGVTTK